MQALLDVYGVCKEAFCKDLAVITRLFKDNSLPVTKTLSGDSVIYEMIAGDFRLVHYSNKILSNDLVRCDVFYKDILVLRENQQPSNVGTSLGLYVKRKFKNKIENFNELSNEDLNYFVENILNREEFTGLEELKFGPPLFSNCSGCPTFLLNVYSSYKRENFHTCSIEEKFKSVSYGVMHPRFEFSKYKGKFYLSAQYRMNNKPAKIYKDSHLRYITQKMSDVLRDLENYSTAHIFGMGGKYHSTNSIDYFFCDVGGKELLLSFNMMGGLDDHDSGKIRTAIRVHLLFDLLENTVSLEIVKQDRGHNDSSLDGPEENFTFNIDSKFIPRSSEKVIHEYGNVYAHDLDHKYYAEYVENLIIHLALTYMPSRKALKLSGCSAFMGALSIEDG